MFVIVDVCVFLVCVVFVFKYTTLYIWTIYIDLDIS